MSAVPINLTIEAGSDWAVEFNLRDENGDYIDLTGYTLSCKMARNYTTLIKYSLNPQIMDTATGLIKLSMPNTGGSLITKTQDLKPGRYVWNLLATNQGGDSDRVIEGVVTVKAGVL